MGGATRAMTAIFGPTLFGVVLYPVLAESGLAFVIFLLAGAMSISVLPVPMCALPKLLRQAEAAKQEHPKSSGPVTGDLSLKTTLVPSGYDSTSMQDDEDEE